LIILLLNIIIIIIIIILNNNITSIFNITENMNKSSNNISYIENHIIIMLLITLIIFCNINMNNIKKLKILKNINKL